MEVLSTSRKFPRCVSTSLTLKYRFDRNPVFNDGFIERSLSASSEITRDKGAVWVASPSEAVLFKPDADEVMVKF